MLMVHTGAVSLPDEGERHAHGKKTKKRRGKRDLKRRTQGATDSSYFTDEEMGGWGYTEHPLMRLLEACYSSPTPGGGGNERSGDACYTCQNMNCIYM